MKEPTRNVIVGATALTGLAGLALLMVLFGYVPRLLEKGYLIRVELEHAGGLGKGNRVRLSGIDIGRITGIDLQAPPKVGVVAILMINPDIAVPRGVRATVVAPILTGSPSLAFDVSHLDEEQLATPLPTDGSAVIQGEVPELVSELAGHLRMALEGSAESIKQELRQPLAKFDRIEKNFNDLSQQWTEVGRNVNQLLEDRSPDQVDQGQVKANLTTVLKRTDRRLAEMKVVLADARRWIEHAGTVADSAGAAAEKLGTTADTATRSIEQLTHRYVALADDLSKTIADVRKLTAQATAGQGAVGKLLNDPALYDSLQDTAERIGQAADALKLLIEKWQTEGVPVQW